MPSRKELLEEALKDPKQWVKYLQSLSPSEHRKARDELAKLVGGWQDTLENLEYSLQLLESTIKMREDRAEADRRKMRQRKTAISLRGFLSQPELQSDVALRDLHLCTRTGATVLLEGLLFTTDSGPVEVKSSNEAKKLFQLGCIPEAHYRLHYVRDGQISAGFSWDRPFLDEVLLLPNNAGH